MQPTAIKGTFADFKLVKTRKLAQVVIEIPIEEADHALTALGGLPRSDGERWVAIARLTAGAAAAQQADTNLGSAVSGRNTSGSPAPKRKLSEMQPSQRAALLCQTPEFQRWLNVSGEGFAAHYIRTNCGITSRAQLDTNPDAHEAFCQIEDAYRRRNDPPPHTEPR